MTQRTSYCDGSLERKKKKKKKQTVQMLCSYTAGCAASAAVNN